MSCENDTSRIERTRYGKRESTSTILEADNLSVRGTSSGGLILELFRYHDKTGSPLESYSFHLCALDCKRLQQALHSLKLSQ